MTIKTIPDNGLWADIADDLNDNFTEVSSGLISDTTLVGTSTSISSSALSNLTEFDFELHLPPVGTVLNLFPFINADTVVTNYQSQIDLNTGPTEFASSANTPVIGNADVHAGTLLIGEVRVIAGHAFIMGHSKSMESSSVGPIIDAAVFHHTVITDVTGFQINSSTATVFPIGTRLVIKSAW